MRALAIRDHLFEWSKRAYIMGILNATPDSFSDGNQYVDPQNALLHALNMVKEGADIIDIGGESTRPGAKPVYQEEEIERIILIIQLLRQKSPIPISVDTYRAKTAEEAIKAGADFVNDIWGLKADPEMACVVAQYQVPVCLMHNRKIPDYENFIEDVIRDLEESIELALKKGVKDKNIMIDPGIGFGKTYEQNLKMMRNLSSLKTLGYPILLGTSRKSFIGLTLDLPVDQRLEGTIATTVAGIIQGANMIRVHDVLQNRRAAIMTERIYR